MTDKEKLIVAIERAKEQSEEYGLDRILVDFKAADMILEMLKEQEPVSAAGPDSYEEYWDREAICPDCGTHWMSYDKNGKRVTKYCPGCRRPVKWE